MNALLSCYMPKPWGKVRTNIPHPSVELGLPTVSKEDPVSVTPVVDPRRFMVLTSNERAQEVIRHVNEGYPHVAVECESQGPGAMALYTGDKNAFVAMQSVLRRTSRLPRTEGVSAVQWQGPLTLQPTKTVIYP